MARLSFPLVLPGDEQVYKRLQILDKGVMRHSTWLPYRRDEPGFNELFELVIKTTLAVDRVMRDMKDKGRQA